MSKLTLSGLDKLNGINTTEAVASTWFWFAIGLGVVVVALVVASYFLFLRRLIITNWVPANIDQAIFPVSGGESSNSITASTDNDTHNQKNSNTRYHRGTELVSLASLIADWLAWLLILAFIFLLFKSQSITIFSVLGAIAFIITPVSAGRMIIASMEIFIALKYPSSPKSTIQKKASS
jgi:hypothetical protein